MSIGHVRLLTLEGVRRLHSGEERAKATLVLGILVCLALPCYLIVSLLIPLTKPYLEAPSAALIEQWSLWSSLAALPLPLPETAGAAIAISVAIVVVLMACYVLALLVSRGAPVNRRNVTVVVGGALILFLTSIIALPNLNNTDLYLYMLHARVFNEYGANPLTVAPATFIDDPLLVFAYVDGTYIPSLYGPAWTLLSVIAGSIAGDGVVANLFAFRLLLLILNLGNALLIWMILGRVNPGYRLTGLIFYCWNPIVVLKGFGHVDPMIVLFLLAGLYLYIVGQKWIAVPALAIASITKFITAPLLVIYLFFISKRKIPILALIGCGVVGGAMLLLLPENLFTLRRMLALPLFGIVLLWAIQQAHDSVEKLLISWGVVMLSFSILFMPVDRIWYLITLIGVISLISSRPIAVMAVALSALGLLNHMFGEVIGPIAPIPVELSALIWYVPSSLLVLWMGRAYFRDLIMAGPTILQWGKSMLVTKTWEHRS